jgi:hypothetical protein
MYCHNVADTFACPKELEPGFLRHATGSFGFPILGAYRVGIVCPYWMDVMMRKRQRGGMTNER